MISIIYQTKNITPVSYELDIDQIYINSLYINKFLSELKMTDDIITIIISNNKYKVIGNFYTPLFIYMKGIYLLCSNDYVDIINNFIIKIVNKINKYNFICEHHIKKIINKNDEFLQEITLSNHIHIVYEYKDNKTDYYLVMYELIQNENVALKEELAKYKKMYDELKIIL